MRLIALLVEQATGAASQAERQRLDEAMKALR
jgi:hypothetical protein